MALAAAVLGPPELAALGCAGFLLAATVLGFLAGSALPPAAVRLAHPLVVCAATTNAGAALLGALNGSGYLATLRTFLTKVGQGLATIDAHVGSNCSPFTLHSGWRTGCWSCVHGDHQCGRSYARRSMGPGTWRRCARS